MEAIWEIIAPYVGALGAAIGTGITIYSGIRLSIGKFTHKQTVMLDSMFNVDLLSKRFADKIAGKTLNIDVTAVTEKALRKLQKQFDDKITELADTTNSYKHLLALIGNAMTKLKALSAEEVNELTGAIQAIEGNYKPVEPEEVMTVVLEPISIDEEEPVKTGVNFEGLK